MKQLGFLECGIDGVKTADNWKARDTAREAAADMALAAKALRLKVLNERKTLEETRILLDKCLECLQMAIQRVDFLLKENEKREEQE